MADRPYALWLLKARVSQVAPQGDWLVWLLLAGRGYGKGRAASNWLARKAVKGPADAEWVVLAPTYQLVRRVCVEGPSGLLAALGGEHGPLVKNWNRSMGELALASGATIFAISADEPDRLRGLNLSGGWVDELCSMARADELWTEALIPALRVGHPRLAVTTTPRPTALLRDLVGRTDGSVVVVRGSTWENEANLPPEFLAELRARYAGTRIGRQELEAEILDDVVGALWQRAWLDRDRVPEAPPLDRIVVAVDPSESGLSDETGIVVVGRAGSPLTGHCYVLDDRSCLASPATWGRRAWLAYRDWEADALVWERNFIPTTMEGVLRSAWQELLAEGEVSGPTPRMIPVNARRNKKARAEPVVAQYEQGRFHHVGAQPVLEDQLTSWVPDDGESPDRLDALVWAAYDLTVTAKGGPVTTGTAALNRARLPSTAGTAMNARRQPSPLARRR